MYGIDLLYIAVIFGSILISMTAHEAMHGFVSYWLGDDTAKLHGRLTFNPIAHIDPITTVMLPLMLALLGAPPFGAAKPVPFNPSRLRFGDYGAALVGLAGPLTNFALALVAGLVVRLASGSLNLVTLEVLHVFVMVNVSFFVFNLIPFPPLDGSRVLYAFAPERVREIMERIEGMGFIAIAVFMLLFYAVLADPFVRILEFLINLIVGQ